MGQKREKKGKKEIGRRSWESNNRGKKKKL
jgi:hypothetical protein